MQTYALLLRLIFVPALMFAAKPVGAIEIAPASWSLYLSGSAGSMTVDPNNDTELKKTGQSFSASVGARRHWGQLSANAALGLRAISLENEGTSPDVYSEAVNAIALSFDLGVAYNIRSWLQPGLMLRTVYGPNTVVTPDVDDKNTSVSSGVAVIDFPFSFGKLNVLPGVFYERSVSLKPRTITSVGLSLAFEFPAPDRPYYDDVDVEEVDDDARDVSIVLSSSELEFDPKTQVLTVDSFKKLKRMARFLRDNEHLWTDLEIRDHHELSNDEQLAANSQKRADAVREVLVSSGVDAKRLTATAQNSSRNVKELAPDDIKNRRIELLFKGVRRPTLLQDGLRK